MIKKFFSIFIESLMTLIYIVIQHITLLSRNLNYGLMCVFKIHLVYVGTAGGAADGVSLPRNNWMLKKASTPKIMAATKQVICGKRKFELNHAYILQDANVVKMASSLCQQHRSISQSWDSFRKFWQN